MGDVGFFLDTIMADYRPYFLYALFPVIFIMLRVVMYFGKRSRAHIAKASNPDKLPYLQRKLIWVRLHAILLGVIILLGIVQFFYQAFI